MCVEGLLIPGNVPHTFLYSSASPQQSKFDPVPLFVSAVNLHCECSLTLLRALADSHPDRKVWLQSYYEEKQGCSRPVGSLQAVKVGSTTCLVEATSIGVCERVNNECESKWK
jgi:hypothetical protein